jgi:hypothetical protein
VSLAKTLGRERGSFNFEEAVRSYQRRSNAHTTATCQLECPNTNPNHQMRVNRSAASAVASAKGMDCC